MNVGSFALPWDLILRTVTLLIMGTGMLVIPILPGLVIIWAAALGYGLAAGFGMWGWLLFALITLLMLAGTVLDQVLMSAQAHREGAPWWVVMVATLSALPGSLLIPVPLLGGILAALAVLLLVQWLRLRNIRSALGSLRGMLIGWGWALMIRFIIALVMISLWLVWSWA